MTEDQQAAVRRIARRIIDSVTREHGNEVFLGDGYSANETLCDGIVAALSEAALSAHERESTEGELVMAERLRYQAKAMRRAYGLTNGYIDGCAGLMESAADMLCEPMACAPPAEPQGWRPIATAPKDGTPILGCRSGWVYPSCRLWSDGAGLIAGWHSYDVPPQKRRPYTPTHWMPLPAAPAAR